MKRSPLNTGLVLLLLLAVAVIPAAASPAISRISPATGPNTGDVTLTITGSGFNANSSVWMSSCDAGSLINGTVVSWSPSSLTCRFSINGQPPGKYNVFVTSPFTDPLGNYIPAEGCEFPQGFEIRQAGGTPDATSAPLTATTTATKVPTAKRTPPGPATVITVQRTAEPPAPGITTPPGPARSPATKAPVKIPTSWPADTPPEPSPPGIGPVIIATGAALLLIQRK